MKRIVAVALTATACGGLLSIELERSAQTVVPAGTVLDALLGDLGLSELAAVDYTDATELENQGVEPGDLRHVHLARFRLVAVDPPGATLDFLDRVELYVEAPSLPRVRIAAADVADGSTEVDLETDDVDLVRYVTSRSMTLSTEVSGSRPSRDTTLSADLVLDIEATARGACNAARRR